MLRKLSRILFRQADAPARITATRVSLGAAALRTLWHLPDGSFFEEHADTVMSEQVRGSRGIRLSSRQYDALRFTAMTGMALWTVGVRHPLVRLTAAAGFIATSGYVAQFHPRSWNYNSHLSIFVAVSAAADIRPPVVTGGSHSEGTAQLQSVALASMQLGAAAIYSQAGLSKLIHGGREWMSTGRTVRGALVVLGTPEGARVARNERLMRGVAVMTVFGELAFLPVLLARWQDRRLVGIAATVFHAATKRYLGISFWHLWWLYPALFIVPLPGDDRDQTLTHRMGLAVVRTLKDLRR